ncbi:MAG: hypothetical protein IJ804_04780 [Prevotella sp.]|nr:hypothetical protein [Prevotella sp.]
MKKIIITSFLLGAISVATFAQSGTNSPYSQYGLGVLSDQSQGFNRGMGGLSYGLRYGNQVNMKNPASYSAVDSLSMIFDAGLSLQLTNFKENGNSVNARNADFEYAVGLFRILPKVGVSVGVLPFTNVGYSYSTTETIGSSTTTSTQTYSGSGGIHQAYLGIGWNPIGGLSLGANISYLWGSYERTIAVTNSDASVNKLDKVYSATINSYKLDFGLQYVQPISKNDVLTIGAVAGIKHKLGADASLVITNTNYVGDSTPNETVVPDAFTLPLSLGAGFSWNHRNSLIFGADYSLQKWGSVDFPVINEATDAYQLTSGVLKDRHQVTLGGEWIPNPFDARHFLNRVHYRLGVSYATPYINVRGQDGPKELSVSAGFGIPIFNIWNNRSMLNISGQWVHSSATGMLKENTFRINIGITFNERWFQKWKVQ